MPLDKPQNIPNSSLSTPYTIVNSDVAELGSAVATFYSGPTSQRPSSNVTVGDQYWNTQLKQLEVYTENGWVVTASIPSSPSSITVSNNPVVYGGSPSALVTFIPAATDTPAAYYRITTTPTTSTITTTEKSISFPGLTAGTSYTFSVVSGNSYGVSAALTSSSLTAGTLSQPPTNLSASTSNKNATITFTAPSNTGAAPVTSYIVYSNPGNISASGSSSPITISGLTFGTPYTFTAVAVNNAGSSVLSLPSNQVTPSAITAPSTVEVLVVAGGGGGAGGTGYETGSGGGAGGYRYFAAYSPPSNSLTVTVGAGGASVVTGNQGNRGNNSVFGTITATYGGGGKYYSTAGEAGGSGGGGAPSGGAGNLGGYTPSEGNAGSGYSPGSGPNTLGGGGGGATQGNPGHAGGAGATSSITGVSVTYAGGGGGGSGWDTGNNPGAGGAGGGGQGVFVSTAGSGAPNTGGGGGAVGQTFSNTGTFSAGAGGSGVVIMAYASAGTSPLTTIDAGLTYSLDTTTRAGYRIYKFTQGTGTVSW